MEIENENLLPSVHVVLTNLTTAKQVISYDG